MHQYYMGSYTTSPDNREHPLVRGAGLGDAAYIPGSEMV